MNTSFKLLLACGFAIFATSQLRASDADFMNQIVGTYDWSYTSYLGTATPHVGVLSISKSDYEDAPENEVEIMGIYENYPVYATISDEDKSFTISRQPIWWDDLSGRNILIVKEYWDYDLDQWAMSDQPLVGHYDDGVITFPGPQTISVYVEDTGFLAMYGKNLMTKRQVKDPFADAKWTDAGTARLMDGWLIPGYDLDQAEYIYETRLEQDLSTPGRYRLVEPYGDASPLREANRNTSGGWIVFNVGDPDCVTVYPDVPSGFNDGENGDFYMYNIEGYLVHSLDHTVAEVKTALVNQQMPVSAMRDGVVSIANAVFGVTSNPGGCFEWGTSTEKADMTTKIFMPGSTLVVSPEVAESDARSVVEYYNLQGMRVDRPTPGAVYVRRSTDSVTKVLVR